MTGRKVVAELGKGVSFQTHMAVPVLHCRNDAVCMHKGCDISYVHLQSSCVQT